MTPALDRQFSLRPLTIAAVQPLCHAGDVVRNAAVHANAVRSAGARVVVFPELSLTGYELDASTIAVDDSRLAPIVAACAEARSIALVGAPVQETPERCTIATIRVDPCGFDVAYRKIWLHGSESDRFTAGSSPVVIDVDGWRLGLAICRDTAFPEHAEQTAELDMDVYVAGVIEHPADAARIETRGEQVASNHHVWVVTASFAGSTGPFRPAAGGSTIIDPDGAPVAKAGAEVGAVAAARLQPVSATSGRA